MPGHEFRGTVVHPAGQVNGLARIGDAFAATGPGRDDVSAHRVSLRAFGTPPRAIEESEIPGLIDHYAQGARRAVEAGFDAVELHGAHGYLLSQFLSPKTNRRTDDWGGSLRNRARFALEVVRAVRDQVGDDFPVLYRVSVEEPYEDGLSLEDGLAFCEMLELLVDAIDVSAGNYDTALTLLPMVAPGSLLGYAKAVKQRVSVPVIGVGRLAWLLNDAQRAVEDDEMDFVSLGRSQLADPDTVRKTRAGQPASVRRCLAVNECISRWMFNGQSTQCVINPELGQERRAAEARRPSPVRRHVLVAGAGPAGCEAALLAAQRGHAVELVERGDRLGGQLRAWSAASVFHSGVEGLLTFYETELPRAGVEVRLGTGAESLDLAAYDAVLLATGTESDSTGEQVDAVDMLARRRAPEVAEITVFGETETALFAALWLAEQNKRVTLSSPADEVGIDSNDMERDHLTGLLTDRGITVLTGQSEPGTGTVVRATARVPSAALDEAVDGERVQPVGTRLRGGRLYEATQSGFWSAPASDPRRNAMTVRAIEHIGITVPDLEQATEFLAEAFGARILYDMLDEALAGPEVESGLGVPAGARIERIRMLRLGDGPNLELFTYSGTAQRDPALPSDFGIQHFCVYVDDIEAAAERLQRAGGWLLSAPGELPGGDAGPGNRYLYPRTPWGSTIELFTYPSAQAYESGTSLRRWRPASTPDESEQNP